MTIESYRNFVAIVENGSISAASKVLSIAQPALSYQLKTMEQNFNVKLINRGAKGIELTTAGEILYDKAKYICSMEDSAKKEINDTMSGIKGTLKISLPPSNPDGLRHDLFDKFAALHPDVNYEIYENLSQNVAENVKNGISEIGFIRSDIKESRLFNFIPYEKEELMVVVSANHELSQKKEIKLSDIIDRKIATPAGCVENIENAFRSLMVTPNFFVITSIRATAIHWALDYNCVALVPCGERDIKEANLNVHIQPISDYDFSSQRAFITLKSHELSPLAKEFIKMQKKQ